MARMDENKVHERRHPEWSQNQIRWRWLLDSYEGGNVYRQAVYGMDARGTPVRNLIRHKREYPEPREAQDAFNSVYPAGNARSIAAASHAAQSILAYDPAVAATDDDYELRRARTPVPTFVREAVETHLGKIYDREVVRETTIEPLGEWWLDVDGRGTSIDDWMTETIAPVLMTLGQIDLLFDHPRAPEGATVQTLADQKRLGLSSCVASLVLPENVMWWCLDERGRYEQALVREYPDDSTRNEDATYRLWTAKESTLYDSDGEVLETIPHKFGRVPLIRIFDRRKVRCRNVGQSRYEAIAERQREYYNRDSELILSDTLQAHPILQGPDDYCQNDGSVPIGPGYLLPKKKNDVGNGASYEGFDYVDPPKGAADSLRINKEDIRNDVDRDAGLTKPAGAKGSTGGTVSQSGVSKRLDSVDGNARLSQIARTLARAEYQIAEMALVVIGDTPDVTNMMQNVTITYPGTFDLDATDEIAAGTTSFQDLLERAGQAPKTEILLLDKLARTLLPGRDDETYDEIAEEIKEAVEAKAEQRAQSAEMGMMLANQSMQGMGGSSSDPETESDPEAGDEPPDEQDQELD